MNACLDGLMVLVLDDSAILALDAQDLVEELGGVVVGPAAAVSQARILLADTRVQVALLDVQLVNHDSYPLARDLLGLGVIVIFLTSCARSEIETEFCDVPLVSKLALQGDKVAQIRKVMEAA